MYKRQSQDDAKEVEQIIVNAMKIFPDLKGIFVASGGQEGVKAAFDELNLEKRPYVIIYDVTPENVKALNEDTVDFLIDQEGYEPVSYTHLDVYKRQHTYCVRKRERLILF